MINNLKAIFYILFFLTLIGFGTGIFINVLNFQNCVENGIPKHKCIELIYIN